MDLSSETCSEQAVVASEGCLLRSSVASGGFSRTSTFQCWRYWILLLLRGCSLLAHGSVGLRLSQHSVVTGKV